MKNLRSVIIVLARSPKPSRAIRSIPASTTDDSTISPNADAKKAFEGDPEGMLAKAEANWPRLK